MRAVSPKDKREQEQEAYWIRDKPRIKSKEDLKRLTGYHGAMVAIHLALEEEMQ